MVNVFRLVREGRPDRYIVFDELPKRLLKNIPKLEISQSGLPREWKKFSPIHYILHIFSINADKEKWQEITSFVRKAVDLKTRLLDKIEDMAIPIAQDSKSEITLSPEELVPIIIPVEFQEKEIEKDLKGDKIITEELSPSEHAHFCLSKGRRGSYTEGCPRCDSLKG